MPSTPLFAPREFFEQHTPSFAGAVLILYLTGVVAVASGLPFLSQFSDADFSVGIQVVAVLLGGGIGAAGIWVVSTALVYILSRVAGGVGSVTSTVVTVGWVALPLLLVNTISTATVWVLHLTGGLPTTTPTQTQLPEWLVLLNTVTGFVGYLWIGYILTYAIHDVHDLTVRRAAAISGVVILVPLLSSISTLVS
ncbi:hypothetical protein E6P09_00720 [Haloferax mediterranei ATCC 33500]|uniref:Yip1 domain-containing protein n=1 Tax=Haloferax mediterranei (strain ATCC 33500 / DSM 1411 / JCM 8866 / NBRC 14739 / NCIMB 2177 / R-4) TaxID=523841 RepID=I3R6M3_HALMT|nr:YIP1 family protein [Haloferax mediterranei]AFK19883.1 hypothetical protein HFX_2194 [Haloferax mediterranei ATCC 33500]AHZ23262.1 hypothetical protein BM92_11715 [Haloferax mediterranei ATCC 33500]ELZ99427.1 hypothetical protein C439_12774 [Haloferax mediterranei ATCC 33500]MDX5987368.1 YIP1 family protein [Haloferax mediterranei ATCC 33500]QCQ73876.1 hypothetical protein E6P09_00720 [Haloferax mediterranei ATCC 33500]